MDDSTRKSLSVSSLTSDETDITAIYKNLTENDNVTWVLTGVKMPSGWTFAQICDANCYENVAVGTRKNFDYTATFNNLKPTIKHTKKEGYGYITVRTFKTSDSAGTVTNTRFSLLISKASVGVISSDVSEKLLYYFDKKIFVDREFTGANLEVFDIKGQMVLNTKVKSDNIDFTPLTGGIYIARISRDGEILKSHKFTTAK